MTTTVKTYSMEFTNDEMKTLWEALSQYVENVEVATYADAPIETLNLLERFDSQFAIES